jgi:glycerophosphoryl diester phosphodiesterase
LRRRGAAGFPPPPARPHAATPTTVRANAASHAEDRRPGTGAPYATARGNGAGAAGDAGRGHRIAAVHPFLQHDGPLAIAHRGGAEEAPENTLAAFAHAVDLGYRYLETDAHVTRDGVAVAFHDARLDRVTDRTGAIEALTIREVDAATVGGVPEARVPRMEELLTRWPLARVNIDPKSDAVVESLCALLDGLGAWDRVCLGSFSDARLQRVRALSGGRACTSMGPRATALARAASAAGVMPRLGADCVQVPLRIGRAPVVTRRFVRAAHRAGLPVHVWTIDDEATMDALLDLGVDGIMTDRPRVLADVFARRRLRLG